MRKYKVIAIAAFTLLNLALISQTKGKAMKQEFKIDNNIVSEKEFNRFKDSLQIKEVDGTYMCAKTTDGGRTSYEAKDKNGQLYLYISTLKGKSNTTSICKKTK